MLILFHVLYFPLFPKCILELFFIYTLVYLGVQGPPFPGGPKTVFGKRKLSVGNLGVIPVRNEGPVKWVGQNGKLLVTQLPAGGCSPHVFLHARRAFQSCYSLTSFFFLTLKCSSDGFSDPVAA